MGGRARPIESASLPADMGYEGGRGSGPARESPMCFGAAHGRPLEAWWGITSPGPDPGSRSHGALGSSSPSRTSGCNSQDHQTLLAPPLGWRALSCQHPPKHAGIRRIIGRPIIPQITSNDYVPPFPTSNVGPYIAHPFYTSCVIEWEGVKDWANVWPISLQLAL
jgi:hypothetical protein